MILLFLSRLEGSGLNKDVSVAFGITETRSAGTLALSTVFSFLLKYKLRKSIHLLFNQNYLYIS